jgi:hypothetical protein
VPYRHRLLPGNKRPLAITVPLAGFCSSFL